MLKVVDRGFGVFDFTEKKSQKTSVGNLEFFRKIQSEKF